MAHVLISYEPSPKKTSWQPLPPHLPTPPHTTNHWGLCEFVHLARRSPLRPADILPKAPRGTSEDERSDGATSLSFPCQLTTFPFCPTLARIACLVNNNQSSISKFEIGTLSSDSKSNLQTATTASVKASMISVCFSLIEMMTFAKCSPSS